jgi:hypothetical protein
MLVIPLPGINLRGSARCALPPIAHPAASPTEQNQSQRLSLQIIGLCYASAEDQDIGSAALLPLAVEHF